VIRVSLSPNSKPYSRDSGAPNDAIHSQNELVPKTKNIIESFERSCGCIQQTTTVLLYPPLIEISHYDNFSAPRKFSVVTAQYLDRYYGPRTCPPALAGRILSQITIFALHGTTQETWIGFSTTLHKLLYVLSITSNTFDESVSSSNRRHQVSER
jgi:hypothetical protein